MKCPICGMIGDKNASTCPRCGHDYNSEIKQTFCFECGAPVASRARVCLMCGVSLAETDHIRRVPRVPLPRIAWLPFLPTSVRLTFLVGTGIGVLLLGLVFWVVGPLLAKNVEVGKQVVLTTPAHFLLPTPTATLTRTPTPTSTATVTLTPTDTRVPVYHIVAMGENPGSIASQYGMSLEQLMEANDITDPRRLRVGQALLIPPTWTPEDSTPDPNATPTATPFMYIVQAGDNLSSIAIWAGTTVEEIMRLNKLDNPRWLSVGQQLAIPAPARKQGTPTPTLDMEFAVHIVQKGESLLGLAIDYNTSIEAIMRANHLEDERFIRAGESLIIPLGTPTPTPLPTPLPTHTPTPGPPYPAPVPLLPPEEHRFWGDTDPILLNWMSVGVLGDDDWYLVELRHIQNGEEVVHYGWTRSTSWRVPPSLYPGAEEKHRLFRWQVRVVQTATPDVPDPARLKSKSPRSTMRTFYWH